MRRTPSKNEGAAGGGGNSSVGGRHEEEANDLDALAHMRGLAKGKLTRVKNMLEQVAGEEMTLPKVKVLGKKIEAAYSEFNACHERIMAITPANKRKDQDCKYLEFESLYDNVSLTVETLSEGLLQAPVNALAIPNQQLIVQQSLPRAIPQFDGRFDQWEKFKVMFRDVVDRSNDLPRIKLYHLEKALIGDAAGIIDAKTISDGNYDRAWEILTERFEDKRRLVDHHISGLLKLRKMTHESFSELRTLLDSCIGHVENLKYLGQEFSGVSEMIVTYLLTNSLDDETKKLWDATVLRGEMPHYNNTVNFLKGRISILERCQKSTTDSKVKHSSRVTAKLGQNMSNVKSNVATSISCEFCTGEHVAFKCSTFNDLSVENRLKLVREKQVCFNCLRRGHRGAECKSTKTCSKCKRRHHTLLHAEGGPAQGTDSSASKAIEQPVSQSSAAVQPSDTKAALEHVSTTAASNMGGVPTSQIFLLTATVVILDKHGQQHTCRALLDSGSQVNFISKAMHQKIQTESEAVNIPITGVNSLKSNIRQRVKVQVLSRQNDFKIEMDCLVSGSVTGMLPIIAVDTAKWNIPTGIVLADPMFYQPREVDLLIGMEWLDDILKPSRLKLPDDLPTLQDSQFGWLVGGKCVNVENSMNSIGQCFHVAVSTSELSEQIQRFWEIESVHNEESVASEAEQCELHFQSTFKRNEEGRYIVQFPLKESFNQLGNSRSMALKRFYALEYRLLRNPEIKKQHDEFIEEYEQLGHCKEVNEEDDPEGIKKWYLPHHAVLKPTSSTTKCRVVFDASAKVGGTSLNDVMMIGPTIQPDLLTIILKFRLYRYVLSADIAKMYRQVLKNECHTPLQRIFYRKNPTDPIKVLELKTVTYGTAAAPFLAIRALYQLAIDEQHSHPMAANVVKKKFYVDNVFGGNDLNEVIKLQQELISLLNRGGFHLHKWAANDVRLLDAIPAEDRDEMVRIEEFSANEAIKTLGLMWDPVKDEFIFLAQPDCSNSTPTKRQVLSTIARLFDPLGLLSPVIVLAKALMQRLWKNKLKWDDPIDGELLNDWRNFLGALPLNEEFRVVRQVVPNEAKQIEIHGFADASQIAYGAGVYLRSIYNENFASLQLVTSKSKVCPIPPLSIPRKELLAARLLYRLVKKVIDAMELKGVPVILWSDSQVVLAWLSKPLEKLQIFARNRVAEIVSTDNFE
ncbi:uncharacterized protein LOC129716956 [Wyeomyia smithii]|uniref:uncharacterized protein LOC129716956 n=1 Tax=Wyeomyia smithii TaxID=174621 RepID=UPI002467F144|nr:uncharacterized protein LOC129716956 [Wyeomyia smithii]